MIWEDTLYDFRYFQFVKVGNVAQCVVYLGESSMCTWEEMYILLLFDDIFYKLDPVEDGVV